MPEEERPATTVTLPRELVEAVDAIVGEAARDAYVAGAIREKVRYDAQGKALDEAFGILDLSEYPEWSTPEKVSAWVHAQRYSEDSERASA